MEADASTGKRATVTQVARNAGVSPATVSRVIHHPELVGHETKARVLGSMRSLGYGPPFLSVDRAGANAPGPIVVDIPWFSNPFYDEIIRGVQTAAGAQDLSVLVSSSSPEKGGVERYCESLARCNASGLITLRPIDAATLRVIDAHVPVVQCCEYNPEVDIPYVSIDDARGARDAVEHLVACGCERIALLNGPQEYKYARERRAGFDDVMTRHGLEMRDSWVVQMPDNSYQVSYTEACKLMGGRERPDGVFACSDIYASAVIKSAHRYGLRVPEDVMVVGFDDADIARMVTPSLTTVSQPCYRMGYSAASLLLERIRGNGVAGESLIMETELVVRETTCARRKS